MRPPTLLGVSDTTITAEARLFAVTTDGTTVVERRLTLTQHEHDALLLGWGCIVDTVSGVHTHSASTLDALALAGDVLRTLARHAIITRPEGN